MEMSALPEAPSTAASQPKHCKSKETKKYSETIKSVAHFVVVTIFLLSQTNPAHELSNFSLLLV